MFTLSGSGSDYPILCGWNGGHHMYLDVADRAATDLTFVIKQLKEEIYSCLDRFEVVTNLNRNSVSWACIHIDKLEILRLNNQISLLYFLIYIS